MASHLKNTIRSCRQFARNHLPSGIRQQVGAFAGRFFQRRVRPVLGLYFDLIVCRYRTDGCEFEIPRDLTDRNFRACFLLDDYENEERGLIAKYLRPADRVLEYGGCLGVVACTTNKRLEKGTRHVVVEGNPLLISTIAKNMAINDCSFRLLNAAAAPEPGYLSFHTHPQFVVGGSTRDVGGVRFEVGALPLGDAVKQHGPFNVLILDVEGAELELLEAGLDALKGFQTVILEMHPFVYGDGGLDRCRKVLGAAGLKRVDEVDHTEAWIRPGA